MKELFDAIRSNAVDTARPQPITVDLPNGVKRLFMQDQSTEDFIAIPDRAERLFSVDQIAPYVQYHMDKRGADPIVFYQEKGVQIVLDDGVESRRNNIARLDFAPTPEFSFVSNLAEDDPEFMDAKAMIKLLRRELWSAFENDDKRNKLIKALRVLRFEDDEQEKFGTVKRSITSASGEDDFPEMITLSLRPFDDPALLKPSKVKCHLELDPDSKSIALIPIPAELKAAQDEALQALQELLVNSIKCPIFRGSRG